MKVQWKTAKELYKWAKDTQLEAINWYEKYYLDEVLKNKKLTICSKPLRMEKASKAYLENIKILDDETVADLVYMFNTYEKIDLINICRFANIYESISFFKKSKLSIDGTKYKQGLLRLKQNADELQRLSDTDIKFRIPFLPHETIKDYVDMELRYCLDESVLRSLVALIDDRLKFPKKTQPSKAREKEFYTNQMNLLEEVSDKYKYINKEQGFLKSYNSDEELKEYEHEHQKALQEVRQNYFYYTAKK